jgi:flagellar biosynthesis/type III secretory pathway protein FliH
MSSPASVRVVDGTPEYAFEEIVRARIDAATARGAELGAAEAIASAAGALALASDRLESVVEKARHDVGASAVQLALEIARHLLKAEVEAGRYDLEGVVREALEASGVGRASCTVHLNPKDLLRLEGVPFRVGTELVGDIAVPVGDVHVTAPDGLLVRDLDRAVETIGERILGELR